MKKCKWLGREEGDRTKCLLTTDLYCGCSPVFDDTLILRCSHNKKARELYEAKTTLPKGAPYISIPSVALSAKEQFILETIHVTSLNTYISIWWCFFYLFIYLEMLLMRLIFFPVPILSSFRWFFFMTHDFLTSFLFFSKSFNTRKLWVSAFSCPVLLFLIICSFSHHIFLFRYVSRS